MAVAFWAADSCRLPPFLLPVEAVVFGFTLAPKLKLVSNRDFAIVLPLFSGIHVPLVRLVGCCHDRIVTTMDENVKMSSYAHPSLPPGRRATGFLW